MAAWGSTGSVVVIPAEDTAETLFGEARVANPYSLGDIVNKYDIDPLVWDTRATGGGAVAHVPAESSIRVTSDGTSGALAGIRTHTYWRYQAGRGQRIMLTCVHDDPGQAEQVREWGYYDENDGVFFRLDGTTLSVVVRSSAGGSIVDNVIAQSGWDDNFSELDIEHGNIYEIDFQWLGVGVVRFTINGRIVHLVHHENLVDRVYMRTAVLPVSVDVVQGGAGSSGGMRFICTTIRAEGGGPPPEEQFGFTPASSATIGATLIPVMSIRTAALFNSIENRIQVFPRLLSVGGDQRLETLLVLNAGLTGPSWASAHSESGVEVDTAATAYTNGRVLGVFMTAANGGAVVHLDTIFNDHSPPLRQNGYAGGEDILTVVMVRAGNQNVDARASLTWGEVR